MSDLILDNIRKEHAELTARLHELEQEKAKLLNRLSVLMEAESVFLGEARRRQKDQSRAVGGHARARALSPERRSEVARAAANARWGTKAQDDDPSR